MNPSPNEPRIQDAPDAASRLERNISRLLATLPSERAPTELLQGVWTELALRQSRPWWRRNVLDWPLPAQLAFLAAGLALAAVATVLGLRAPIPQPAQILPGLHALIAVYGVLVHSTTVLLHTIPGIWLRGGLLLGFTVYATLFALLALAHRLLADTRTHALTTSDDRIHGHF